MIKVVMIVSKILSTILFRAIDLWKKSHSKIAKTAKVLDGTPAIAINDRDKSPSHLMKLSKYIDVVIKSSDQVCKISNNIINSCFRFQIIGKKGEDIASLNLYQTT